MLRAEVQRELNRRLPAHAGTPVRNAVGFMPGASWGWLLRFRSGLGGFNQQPVRKLRSGSRVGNMRSILSTAFAALSACFASAAIAQVPLPNPNVPLYTNGVVYAVVRLPDDSTVIGGSFSKVNDTPRANLAKVLPNGSLDPNWNPSTDDRISDLAVDAAGNVIVAGEFTVMNNTERLFIAKVSGTGTGALDMTWNPVSYGSVNTIAIDGNGDIIAGGLFANIGGQARLHLAKLSGSGTGAADPTWNPSADASVIRVAVDASGNIFASGLFEQIGGQTRHYLAKLSGSGQGLADATWNPGVTGNIYALTAYAGDLYVGGYFTNIGGQPRSNLARLSGSGTGAALAGWTPQVSSIVEGIAIDAGGTVYIVGDFGVVNNWIVKGVARLSGVNGAVDQAWLAKADSTVYSVALDGSGNVRIGGAFSTINDAPAGGFVLVDENAATLAQATTDAPGYAYAVVRQLDGGLIVGGHFWKAGTTLRNNLVRIRGDGSVDPNWNPSPDDFSYAGVYALAADASDHIYVGGEYSSIGGQSRTGLARISGHGTGAADAAWDPAVQGAVTAIAIEETGSILIGGEFTDAGRKPRANIARLFTSGAGDADAAWNASADERVFSISVDQAGDIYAGGLFLNIGGQPQKYLAKLSGSTGAAYATWNPVLDGSISVVSAQTDGTVYAAGSFKHIDAVVRGGIARLSGSGSGVLDATWNPNPSTTGSVYALVTDAAGNVYVAGDFSSMGGQSRENVAKLFGIGTGLAHTTWNPGTSGSLNRVQGLALDPNGYLDVVGSYTVIGGQQRGGVAVLPTEFDRIFSNFFQ